MGVARAPGLPRGGAANFLADSKERSRAKERIV